MRPLALVALLLALLPDGAMAQHVSAYYGRPQPVVVIPRGGQRDYAYALARPYNWCEAKSGRLAEFEHRVRLDGRVSRDEARIANALRADLAAICSPRRYVKPRRIKARVVLPPK